MGKNQWNYNGINSKTEKPESEREMGIELVFCWIKMISIIPNIIHNCTAKQERTFPSFRPLKY